MTTTDQYVRASSPIQRELLAIFDRSARLTIFDIGSCEGEDSIRYARLFPQASIYAVEPLPGNVERLRGNLQRYGCSSVTVVEKAFSNSRGRASLHVSSGAPPNTPADTEWDFGNKSSSLLPPDQHLSVHPWVKFDSTVEVETETLDEYCRTQNIDTVDFIHLDVQGAELHVLAGAAEQLIRIRAIWLEVEKVPLYRDQPLVNDVQRFMAERGFAILKQKVDAVSGDQLYVNTALVGSSRLARVQLRLGLRSRLPRITA